MAPVGRQEQTGGDDGPSRPGRGLRRTVIALIGGILLITVPAFLWLLWGIAHPGPGPFGWGSPGPPTIRSVTETLTIDLRIDRADWSRFVYAADGFAAQHGLTDLSSASEVHRSLLVYEGKDAELKVERKFAGANDAPAEVRITIREFNASGLGRSLETAFQNDVVRAGRFDNK